MAWSKAVLPHVGLDKLSTYLCGLSLFDLSTTRWHARQVRSETNEVTSISVVRGRGNNERPGGDTVGHFRRTAHVRPTPEPPGSSCRHTGAAAAANFTRSKTTRTDTRGYHSGQMWTGTNVSPNLQDRVTAGFRTTSTVPMYFGCSCLNFNRDR